MFKFGSIIRSLTDFRRQRQPDRAATNPPYDANAAEVSGITDSFATQQVELAVRRAIHPGMRLHTPGRGYPPRNRMPFVVTAVDRTGINTDKTMGHHIHLVGTCGSSALPASFGRFRSHRSSRNPARAWLPGPLSTAAGILAQPKESDLSGVHPGNCRRAGVRP